MLEEPGKLCSLRPDAGYGQLRPEWQLQGPRFGLVEEALVASEDGLQEL